CSLSLDQLHPDQGRPAHLQEIGTALSRRQQKRPTLYGRRRDGGAGHLSPDLYRLPAQRPWHVPADRQGQWRAGLVEADHRQMGLHLSEQQPCRSQPCECEMKALSLALLLAATPAL